MVHLALSIIVASVLGSLHCVGMCGGLVAWSTAQRSDSRRGTGFDGQFAYHGARWVAYLVLGALAGWLGQSIDRALLQRGLGAGAAILSGSLVVAWAPWRLTRRTTRSGLLGERTLVKKPRGRLRAFGCRIQSALRTLLQGALAWAATRSAVTRSLVVGFASGVLPCGWLYTFVVLAVGTASVARGALVLSAFWLGSVPALVGLSALSRPLLARLGRWSPALAAMLAMLLGIATIAGRLPFSTAVAELAPAVSQRATGDPSIIRSESDAALAAQALAAKPPCHETAPP